VTMPAGPRLPAAPPEAISREMASTSKWRWVQDHWEALRPKLLAYWPRLPKEDVERLSGERPPLVQLVKQHYALQESGAEAQLDAWLAGLSPDSAAGADGRLGSSPGEGNATG